MKPRIYYRAGFWRVSKCPKPFYKHQRAWGDAHRYAGKLNERLVEERAA